MKCPKCKVNLLSNERGRTKIDYCPQCLGVWLDRDELDKIIEVSPDVAPSGKDDPERFPRDKHFKDQPQKEKKKDFFSDLFDF